MKIFHRTFLALVCFGLFLAWTDLARAFWTTGYFPGWEQSAMPASNIDFTTLTHVIHFSLVPNSDGSLNSTQNSITVPYSADVVLHAHAAGRKALICVGGASTETYFQGATSSANLPTFINNLTNFMASRGYDGIDIDWEPLPFSDAQLFTNLVNGLRSALNAFPQAKLLTVAAGAYPPYGDPVNGVSSMYASVQNQFDQINIMTYDMSGPYDGWVTWFNTPLYDGGYHFPSAPTELVPSSDASVANFTNNGVAAAKLAISLAFYGYIWTDGLGTNAASITGPRQSWTNAPTATDYRYSDIMAGYYQSNLYHWDTNAQAAYLGITNSNPLYNEFISYDDQRTCQVKLSYARNHALGGIMIWELAQDHVGTAPSPLIQALKQDLATPGLTSIRATNKNLILTFNAISLGSYRVQWSSNLSGGVWNTLLITNFAGVAAPLQITDAGAATNQSTRYYRIQTPP